MKIKFSKLAKNDFDASVLYYKKESENLASRFKNDIKQSVKRIETFPKLYPKIDNQIQKCVVSKFPFTIYYTIKNDTIYILAVASHYRDLEEYLKRF
ncbi:type II toxin-antitoxin system RelE/ParE family toxin [Arcobacteraceae bacterium]|nr:type II toxin-antitoxin system RelE/ParE family toxin [Arcobacteraceae bacterium]